MPNMNLTAQRLCVWCGPIMIGIWASAFIFLCRFIPPPSPAKSRAALIAQFGDHTNLIRLGLVISLFSCALLVPFCSVIAAQMRRMEGVRSVLAESQLVSGGLLCVEFLLPFAICANKTFFCRPSHRDLYREAAAASASGCTMPEFLGAPVAVLHFQRPGFKDRFAGTAVWQGLRRTPVGLPLRWAWHAGRTARRALLRREDF